MSSTAARRRIIRSLLTDNEVESQSRLVELLAERGFEVTQATVSRDLSSMGAHKDGTHYVLGGAAGQDGAGEALAGIIDAFVVSIEASGNIVVLKTPPGAAQVVAAALDRVSPQEMAGCVAGDDTVMVVVSERASGVGFARMLHDLGASV
jgi:transcriptional regulator of arginine metabolism